MSKVILGGGISGLSTAYYLTKKFNSPVVLYEASDRLGGWIQTRINGNGTLFEQGARTLRFGGLSASNTLELISDLDLTSFMRPLGYKSRFFYIDNKICDLPSSWKALLIKSNLFGEPLMVPILRDVFGKRKKVADETVYDFVLRRFGQKYADILSAVICGIYAGNSAEISIRSAMKAVFEAEQKYGSVCLGFMMEALKKSKQSKNAPSGTWSLEGGMETLPNALRNHLTANGLTEIRLKSKCNRIEFREGNVILDIDGMRQEAEHLYSSLPSKELQKLLGPEHSYLKDELLKIPFVSVAVVNLEYTGNVMPIEGFGLLIPPNQGLPILGIIFDSCIYQQKGKTVLTVMMGGRWFEQYFGVSPETEYILKIATDHVKKILGINADAAGHMVSILRNAIPQYVVGHQETVERINKYISLKKLPLTLVGNSYSGVGIPDAILSARMAVNQISK